MKAVHRWAPAVAQAVAWSAIALIGVAMAMAQISQVEKDGRDSTPSAQDRQEDRRDANEASGGRRADKAQDEGAAGQRQPGRARNGAEEPRRRGEQAGRLDEDERRADRDKAARRDGDPIAPEGGRRGSLGLTLEGQGEEGLTVTEVEPGSAAAQSGFRASDRIVSADGRRFSNSRQLQAYLSGQIGRRVPVIIERNGRQYTVQFTPSGGDDVAWLGVYMEDDEENGIGARVTHVYPTGPAARAGFRAGDVITSVNDKQVEGSPDVIAAVEEQEPGAKAEFGVRRSDQDIKLTATLGRRDAFVFFGRQNDRQEGEFDESDPFGRMPPYVMQLEHDRRMAEQHQRIEEALRDLQEEVKQLRAEISKGR